MRTFPVVEDVAVTDLALTGYGIAQVAEREFRVWNGLPGETCAVQPTKRRRGIVEGVATTIAQPSAIRQAPTEDHFTSCSPWQIMTYPAELAWKRALAERVYAAAGITVPISDIITDGVEYGYRNKMEFSFVDDGDALSLAFFARAARKRVPVQGCRLAMPIINDVAETLRTWLQTQQLVARNCKTIIIRANRAGETIAGIFLKDDLPVELPELATLHPSLRGCALYYSTHKSPASVVTRVIAERGALALTETVLGVPLQYGLHSFFQVNVPVFEQALGAMKPFANGSSVVDLFSGVGAIGVTIAPTVTQLRLVDSNAESIHFAQSNLNGRGQAMAAPSEHALDYITPEAVILVDPPRAGLHTAVVERLLAVCPPRIIYLSCNIETQARDVALLSQAYDVVHAVAYNFFPRTPHIEGLLALARKENV